MIIELWILAVLWQSDVADNMLLPDQSFFTVKTCVLSLERTIATDYYYYWQAIMGGKQKNQIC